MRIAEWPPGKVLLRDTALALFAERGFDAVSVRDVAAAAGVSHGLVVHHFGTKEALRRAVDEHVTAVLAGALAALGEDPAMLRGEPSDAFDSSMVAALVRQLGDSPIPAYVRRSLMSGEAGRDLFRRWFEVSLDATRQWARTGVLRATDDDDLPVLAAFLMVNDLAVFLLRDQLTEVLGEDPLSNGGFTRWTRVVMTTYLGGLLGPGTPGPASSAEPADSADDESADDATRE